MQMRNTNVWNALKNAQHAKSLTIVYLVKMDITWMEMDIARAVGWTL